MHRWMLGLGLGLALGLCFVDAHAQIDKYVEIASAPRRSPIYYDAFTIPGRDGKSLIIVTYKIPNDRLVFMRHHDGGPEKQFRAGLDISVELYRDRDLQESKALKEEAFTSNYEATVDPLEGLSGAVSFQVEPGPYGFRLNVTDQSTSRSAASLVRPIMVPDYGQGAVGKAVIAANVDEQALFTSVELANLGGDAHFGGSAVAVIPFTLGPETQDATVSWTLRELNQAKVAEERKRRAEHIRRRAREAEGEIDIAPDMDEMPSAEGGIVVDSGRVSFADFIPLEAAVPVDILPDRVRLTEASSDTTYYVAIVDLRGERLENGAFALDVHLEGSDKGRETTRFDTHWPDMPFSLFDIDVAIENMRFIISRDDQKMLRGGSKEEKIEKFNAFWAQRDPSPGTAYNELMVEYFKRVDFAALEYRSGAGLARNGLKTDRAKVYVVHGPPDEVTRSFPDRGGVRETWKYTGGRTFTFEAVSSLDPFNLVDGS